MADVSCMRHPDRTSGAASPGAASPRPRLAAGPPRRGLALALAAPGAAAAKTRRKGGFAIVPRGSPRARRKQESHPGIFSQRVAVSEIYIDDEKLKGPKEAVRRTRQTEQQEVPRRVAKKTPPRMRLRGNVVHSRGPSRVRHTSRTGNYRF